MVGPSRSMVTMAEKASRLLELAKAEEAHNAEIQRRMPHHVKEINGKRHNGLLYRLLEQIQHPDKALREDTEQGMPVIGPVRKGMLI